MASVFFRSLTHSTFQVGKADSNEDFILKRAKHPQSKAIYLIINNELVSPNFIPMKYQCSLSTAQRELSLRGRSL